jgi:molybdate transport system ATP-binding protein
VIDIRLAIEGGHLLARVTRRSIAELGLAPGRAVFAVIKSVAIDRHTVSGSARGPVDDASLDT